MFGLIPSLTLAMLLSGCLLIPVPTPGHSYGPTVDMAVLESLRPGEASRTDVLLTLGEPTRRSEDDRYLIYAWTVVHGYGVLFVGAGYTGAMFPLPVTAPNYLCFEFGPKSMLVRRENLRGSLQAKLDMDNAFEACKQKMESKDEQP
jgi:hypothetical protein